MLGEEYAKVLNNFTVTGYDLIHNCNTTYMPVRVLPLGEVFQSEIYTPMEKFVTAINKIESQIYTPVWDWFDVLKNDVIVNSQTLMESIYNKNKL